MKTKGFDKKGIGEYQYKLSNKLYYEKLPKIPGIEFLTNTDSKKRKYVTGFKIIIKNATKQEAEKLSEKKAKNLKNLMCSSCSTYSEANFTSGSFSESNSLSAQISTSIGLISKFLSPINFDKKLLDKLEKDQKFQQNVARMHTALKGFESNNPEAVIRELFNVVGSNMPKELKKYSSLRHVLSHTKGRQHNIVELEESFGKDYFEFTPDKQFDYTSMKNMQNLTTAAYDFYDGVKRFILKI